MSYGSDYEQASHRPTKRRRLVEEIKMARRVRAEDKDLQGQAEEQHQPLAEVGCEATKTSQTPESRPQPEIQTSDRDQFMDGIKRGQRLTWVPKPGLKALYAEEEALQEKRNAQQNLNNPVSNRNNTFQFEDDILFGPWTSGNEPIERARSALHTEDIEEEIQSRSPQSPNDAYFRDFFADESRDTLSGSPPLWQESPPYALIGQAISGMRNSQSTPTRTNRPRAPSLSSSFVMRVPTSPLVNAVSNPHLELPSRSSTTDLNDIDKKGRRRTMPPNSFQSHSPVSTDATPNFSRPLPHPQLRRGSSLPYPSHQPRRSIGSFTFQSISGFQSPRAYERRSSIAEASPKRRTSMVGSFEESILRGRMSSPASKPFDFVAQIGVMGKGDCPASLKCPAHVSISFQAVFYSYTSSNPLRSITDDAPSPYVGTIDVENNLKAVQLATKKRRSMATSISAEFGSPVNLSSSDPRDPENTPIGKALAREAQMHQHEQQTPKSVEKINLGGAYRVPQQGQLQIIIKNSNKTAVKLFLVPYDLQNMEPGTKTFVRQRSYSSGPILEGALSDSSQQPDFFDPLKDKNILRYLIHIRFCCPSRGKFYLYDNIRVVFANRVPEGKEKLRTEVQLPEPKYSPWKPSKMNRRSTISSAVDFRMSPNSHYASSPAIFNDMQTLKLRDVKGVPEEIPVITEPRISFCVPGMSNKATTPRMNSSRQERINFVFPDTPLNDEVERQPERTLSPVQGFFASTSPRSSPVPWNSSGSSATHSSSPGLLSQQFRGLNGSLSNTGTDNISDPWATSASLTGILSKNATTPQETDESKSNEAT